jgi:ABC-type Fe3+-hydroxamate transport system substrate-binding protein
LFASAFAYKIEDVHQLKQTGPKVSGSLKITIGAKSLMPQIMMGAGPNAWTSQYPILIGLANPATFVWTTDCTQYLNEGVANCN